MPSGADSPTGRGARLGYGAGALVAGTFTTLPGLLLLPYLTDTLGVAAVIAGLVVLVPKAWDVLLIPVAGRLSDRTARRPHILFGGLAAAAGFALMFSGLSGGGWGAAVTAAGFCLAATAFAFFQAAYAALPAEAADLAGERMRIVAWRVAGIAVAAVCAGMLAPAVVDAGGGGLAGHRWAGVFGALLIGAGTLAVFATTAAAADARAVGRPGKDQPGRTTARALWDAVQASPSFTALLRCTVLHVVATGCLLAGTPYYAEHALDDKGLVGPMVALFVLPNLLLTPAWRRFGARRGQKTGIIVSSSLFAAGCLLLLAGPLLPLAALAVIFLAGCGHAGQLLFMYGMLADCTAADRATTGHNRAGAMSGCFSAGETAGLAIGPFVFALALQLSGYASSGTGEAAHQDGAATAGILTGTAVLPALGVLTGLVLLRRYRLGPAADDATRGHDAVREPVTPAGRAARIRR
ncbi:MFS transporter [Streptomyces boninensis]|uniref:MFS transporter n=1 Tax=Streptomyces boninensis TaxID=2039455 RepID=UPI003B21501C